MARRRYLWRHIGCIGHECPHCPKLEDPRYAKVLAALLIPRGLRDCVHLGADTRDRVLCPSCSGHVELKLFGCGLKDSDGKPVFGVCTRGKAVSGIACCTTCEEYQPR